MNPDENTENLGTVVANPNLKLKDKVGEQLKQIFTGEKAGEIEAPYSAVKPEVKMSVREDVKQEISERPFFKNLTEQNLQDIQKAGVIDPPLVQSEFAEATTETNTQPADYGEFNIENKPYSIFIKDNKTNETRMMKYTRLKRNAEGQLVYTSPVEGKKASLSLNVPVKIKGKDGTFIKTLQVDVDGMQQDEANQYLEEIYEGYAERARVNYPTANYQSSEEYPLKFTNTGINARVDRTPINSVVGFKDNIYFEVAKRDVGKVFEPIYDIAVDMAIGEGLPFLYELGAGKLETMMFHAKRDYTLANRKKHEDTLDKIHANREAFADAIPSGKYIIEAILGNKPTLKQFERGFAALREEDIGNFLEGKNDNFFVKFFREYATATAFLKATNTILGTVGLGPKGGKDLVQILRGEKEAKGKFFTRLKNNDREFKSGYDFWKSSLKKSDLEGKTEEQLKEAWFAVPASKQSHFINKSFADLTDKVMKSGGLKLFGKTRLRMANSRKNYGMNISQYNKETGMELFWEASVVTGVGELTDNPLYVLPAYVATVGGANLIYNRKRWKRISQKSEADTLIKNSIRAVGAFGEGFASGSDALLYAVTGGRTDVTDIIRRGAMQRVRKQYPGKSTQWYEDYLHTEEGIPSEGFNQILPAFLMTKIIDGQEQEVLVKAGDKEYEVLQDLADQINRIDDPALKTMAVERIAAFNQIQNKMGQIAQKLDKPQVAENLSTALYEVLDLFTATSLVKTMAERADFKYMSAFDLNNAEKIYQSRKLKVDAIDELLIDFAKQAETANVGKELTSVVDDIKKSIEGEKQFLKELEADINNTGDTLDAASSVGTLQQDSVINSVQKHIQSDRKLENSLAQALSVGQDIDKILRKHQQVVRENLLSISDNIKMNHALETSQGKAVGRAQVWETTDRVQDHISNVRAKLIYGNLYKVSAKESINTSQIENLIIQFDDSIQLDPVDILKGKRLPSRIKAGSLLLFENSLIKQGEDLRNLLLEAFELDDIDDLAVTLRQSGIKVNVNSNFDLYRTFLRMKNGTIPQKSLFMSSARTAFEDVSFKANTIVEMDQAIAGRLRQLSRNNQRSVTQQEEFELLRSLQEQVQQTLQNKFGSLYNNTRKAYRQEVGRKKDRQDGVHEKRVNITKSDGDVLEDDFTMAVYNKSTEKQMFEMGKDIVENGGDATFKIKMNRHGTLAKTNRADDVVTMEDGEVITNAKYVIADGDEAFIANVRMNMAVEEYFHQSMKNFQKKYSQSFKDMDELPQEVKDFLSSFFNGPMRENLIKFQSRFALPDNVQVWDQKTLLENGDFNRTSDVAYLRNRNNEIVSTVKNNANKNQINFDDLRERLDQPLALVKESSEEYKKYYKQAIKNIENINRTIKGVMDRDFKLQEAQLQETIGFLQRLNIPIDAKGTTPLEVAQAITADGTGETARALRDLIATEGNIVDKYKIIETKAPLPSKKGFLFGRETARIEKPKEEKIEQANKFVKTLIMHKFVNDVLTPSGIKTPRADIETGNYISSKQQYMVDPAKVAEVKKQYGGIIDEFASEEMNMITDIADYLSFDFDIASKNAGIIGKKFAGTRGVPQAMTVASAMARAFSVIRDVVSPRYIGMEAMIRTARMMKADDAKTLLTSKMTVRLPGDDKAYTALEVIHDLLVNKNYTVKNAQRLERLMPLVIYESELNVHFYPTEKSVLGVKISVPIIGRREEAGYDPKRPEGQPIIKTQPENITDQYKEQMNRLIN